MGSVCGSNTAYSPCGPQCVVFLGSNPYLATWGRGRFVIQMLRGGFLPVSIAQDALTVHLSTAPLPCSKQPHSVPVIFAPEARSLC